MKGRVGKTSILNKYINNKFNDVQEMTINSGYLEKDVTFDNDRFTFCFWVIICNCRIQQDKRSSMHLLLYTIEMQKVLF